MAQNVEQEQPVGIIAQGDLGPGNIGSIGPSSEREAGYSHSLGDKEYQVPLQDESHCMDDRLEVYGIQLGGNRATTETAADMMDPAAEDLPLSQRFEKTVRGLLEKGKDPYFHPGCAALLLLANRQAFEYAAKPENQPLLTSLTDTRVRLLGVDTLSPNDYENAYDAVAQALGKPELWDASADELFELAKSLGAPVDPIEGDHSACATRWDVSEETFDNISFRRNHEDDQGGPMGALSVTIGAYKKQLEDEGYSEQEVALKVFRATLFNVAVLKNAEREGAPDVIVGNTLVVD